METIPSPVYIGILFLMWAFAGMRGGPFPLRLVSLYSYLLHLNYDNLFYQTYNTLLNVHNLFSVILELCMIWLLVEVIDGARGDPIYNRLLAIILYGLSVFNPHSESFHYNQEIERER